MAMKHGDMYRPCMVAVLALALGVAAGWPAAAFGQSGADDALAGPIVGPAIGEAAPEPMVVVEAPVAQAAPIPAVPAAVATSLATPPVVEPALFIPPAPVKPIAASAAPASAPDAAVTNTVAVPANAPVAAPASAIETVPASAPPVAAAPVMASAPAVAPASAVAVTSPDPTAPISIPLDQLASSLPRDSRLAYFVITDQPGLHVLHTASMREAGNMFSRVVALLERRDLPRERISTDAEIEAHARRFHTDPAGLTAGNNFTAPELAQFFEVARRDHVALKPAEQYLQSLLVKWGLIHEADGAWQASSERDFLVTIPGLGPIPGGGTMDARLRSAILSHELGHWHFFSDHAYANACRAFWWYDLNYHERDELTRQLENVGYDPAEHIMIDETQAYLLHTPAVYIPFSDISWPRPLDINDVRRRLAVRVAQ